MKQILQVHGIHWRLPRKKLLFSTKNKGVHLNFAREHLDKQEATWTDESKIALFGHNTNCFHYINYASHAKNLIPTVGINDLRLFVRPLENWKTPYYPGKREFLDLLIWESIQKIFFCLLSPSLLGTISWIRISYHDLEIEACPKMDYASN